MMPIVVPTRSIADWKWGLAAPKRQWKDKFSAKTLARAWEDARGFPPEVKALLGHLGDVELLIAIPEYKVSLPGGAASSQNDIFALAGTDQGLIAVMVEGKVAESFDQPLGRWLRKASAGKTKRLACIKAKLGLTSNLPPAIRYQLLHRTASAVIGAERFHAGDAVLVVQSFSLEPAHLGDYQAFLGLFGKKGRPGQLVSLGTPNGIRLWAGWAQGDAKFLKE